MNNGKNKRRTTFTPEELGLEKITVNGKRYLDVTPLWIDSKTSQKIWKIIEGERPCASMERRLDE